jgi:hypothetical protein
MALRLGPTLAEARRDCAVELNWGAQVSDSTAAHPIIDRMIRKAYQRVQLEFPWAILFQSHTEPLITGQMQYEIPDGLSLGKIERLVAIDTEGREWEIQRGLDVAERAAWGRTDATAGCPLRYDLQDGGIVLMPPPDATRWPTMRFDGYFTPLPPQENLDRIPVDGEAVIGLAVAMLKAHIGSPDAGRAAQDAEIYLQRLRPTEGTGAGFRLGGPFSRKFRYSGGRRTTDSQLIGDGGWWQGWTPSL